MNNYDRQILALDDNQLERFVRDWVTAKTVSYFEVTRFSGSGDLGRDVVGFLTNKRHGGPWHNYQCKQYGKRLPTETAIREIGKVLYYAHLGEFIVPDKYYFVAPRGLNRNLEGLIYYPDRFKRTILEEWDKYCANGIVEGSQIALSPSLMQLIDDFEFANIHRVDLDDILDDASVKPVLFKWFGADPGPAPRGSTPKEVQGSELPYIDQLLNAYGQRECCVFRTHQEVQGYPLHDEHLQRQRERFYDADAFKRFYRDNTDPKVILDFEGDVYHGVVDTCNAKHEDALRRVDAVMAQAANVQIGGPLAQHARVQVKQGICHHFANEDKLQWRK